MFINIIGSDPLPWSPWNNYGTPYINGRRALVIDCKPEENVAQMVSFLDNTHVPLLEGDAAKVYRAVQGYCDAYDDVKEITTLIEAVGSLKLSLDLPF